MSDVRLFIAVPCYGGQIFARCMQSIIRLVVACAGHGISVEIKHLEGESLVQRGRNMLAHYFLKSESTHMLFVDADLAFDPADILAMIQADKPLAGLPYPRKKIHWDKVKAAALRGETDISKFAADYIVNVGKDAKPDADGYASAPVENGFLQVEQVGTGMMLMKRHVLTDMACAYPDSLYTSNSADAIGDSTFAWFDCAIDPVSHVYLSEDFLFCDRWRAMGGKVYMYLPAKVGHIGMHMYFGDVFSQFQPVSE